jgi:hypothetical protein
MEKANQDFQINLKNIHPIPSIPTFSSAIPQEKRNNATPF